MLIVLAPRVSCLPTFTMKIIFRLKNILLRAELRAEHPWISCTNMNIPSYINSILPFDLDLDFLFLFPSIVTCNPLSLENKNSKSVNDGVEKKKLSFNF